MYDGVNAAAQEVLASEDLFFFGGETLEHGDSGDEVRRLQRRLYTLYYIPEGVIDGKIGDKTEDAIREFQTNNRLEPTGVADEETQRALYSADAIAKNTKYKLVVSIADQRVYVYGLNSFGEYELDDTFICSTGLATARRRHLYHHHRAAQPLAVLPEVRMLAQYSFASRGTSGSTPCCTARATRVRCATAACPRWDTRPRMLRAPARGGRQVDL